MATIEFWEQHIASHPESHLLQTAAWGRLKSAFGWQAEFLIAGGTGALVLFHTLPLGFRLAYLPRGPVPSSLPVLRDVLPSLTSLCRSRRAAFLIVEPDLEDGEDVQAGLRQLGLRPGLHTIQPPRTILVDLLGSEEEVLARMKPKTRYNIRLAERHGVAVSPSEDIGAFFRLMNVTAQREAFGLHGEEYYRAAYREFGPHQNSELLLATYREEPIAGLMVFAQGTRAWYLYGASSDSHREVMAPHLLQWEAMRWARSRGCTQYDLWGIPDAKEEALEAQFTSRQDGLWGVYRFKRGFGGRIWRAVGAWNLVYSPFAYQIYRVWQRRHSRNIA